MRAGNKLVVRNVGLMLSGKLEQPILDADCIVTLDGKITAIGYEKDLDVSEASQTIDAKGTALSPGLIDSHVHPVIGDYTPRQQQLSWIDSCLHGGVTCMISAGEVHLPGRPKDIVGLKALAIASQRWYENFRPSGVKVIAGAPVIEEGMEEEDFKELAAAGVTLLGEVGLGSVKANKSGVNEVQKDFVLSTVDIVSDPSAPEAFVNGIMEGREFSITGELEYDIRNEIRNTVSKKLDEKKIRLFKNFMNKL